MGVYFMSGYVLNVLCTHLETRTLHNYVGMYFMCGYVCMYLHMWVCNYMCGYVYYFVCMHTCEYAITCVGMYLMCACT